VARRVTVQEATVNDIESLNHWNDLAGVVEPRSEFVDALIAARHRGVLGAATAGKRLLDRLKVLYEVLRDDWHWACTVVLSLRLDDMQAGMLQAGAHHRLCKFLGEAYYGPRCTTRLTPPSSSGASAGILRRS
jgi:hypothetical protein